MIMNVKTTIDLKTGEIISEEVLGPAGIADDTYYKKLTESFTGKRLERFTKELLEQDKLEQGGKYEK